MAPCCHWRGWSSATRRWGGRNHIIFFDSKSISANTPLSLRQHCSRIEDEASVRRRRGRRGIWRADSPAQYLWDGLNLREGKRIIFSIEGMRDRSSRRARQYNIAKRTGMLVHARQRVGDPSRSGGARSRAGAVLSCPAPHGQQRCTHFVCATKSAALTPPGRQARNQ